MVAPFGTEWLRRCYAAVAIEVCQLRNRTPVFKVPTPSALGHSVAKVIAFVSEKGGVGKTTACYHVATALQRFHEKRVVVLDADYQRGGISGRFFPDVLEGFGSDDAAGTTLFHKYQQLYSAGQRTPDIDVRSWNGRLDVIVADSRLSTVTADKLPASNNIRENNRALLQHLQVIDYVLTPLKTSYDFILMDSHPEVSDVLRSVIYAADYCVSPVKLDRQSSIGVATVIGEINNVNADVEMIESSLKLGLKRKDTTYLGAMAMMCREWGGSLKQTEYWEANRLRRTGGVFESYVTEGDGLRIAAAQRVPVYDVGGANAEKQARQFRALTEELLRRVAGL